MSLGRMKWRSSEQLWRGCSSLGQAEIRGSHAVMPADRTVTEERKWGWASAPALATKIGDRQRDVNPTPRAPDESCLYPVE